MKARISILGLFFVWACGLDNTDLGINDSFIKFFDFGEGYKVEKTSDGGFICVGTYTGSQSWIHLIKTDEYGNAMWISRVQGYIGRDVKQVSNGYIVIGDSIDVSDINNPPAMAVLKFSDSGDLSGSPVQIEDNTDAAFHGQALSIDANGDIIALGTYQDLNDNKLEKIYLTKLSGSDLTKIWSKQYGINSYDNKTGKSLQVNNSGQILWNGSVSTGTNENIQSYIKVYAVEANSLPVNDESITNSSINYFASDIQPIGNNFAIIGTTTTSDGSSSIYFIKVDQSGNLINSSEKFIADPALADPQVTTPANVEGIALSPTNDSGLILLCSRTSPLTDNYGKGERDFLLIKTDNSGNTKWWKVIGGPGDEYGGSVIQTDMTIDNDGSFVIFGTSDFQGTPRMVLIKTTSKGVIN